MSLLRRLVANSTLAVALAWSIPLAAAPRANQTALEALRSLARASYDAGVVAYRQGRYEAAIDCFRRADGLLPSAALSYNTARAYERLGDQARALDFYREFLRRDPEASNVRRVHARVAELEAALMDQGIQQLTVRSEP